MLHLSSSSGLGSSFQTFLDRNPTLSQALLVDCDHDIERVATTIEPVLSAPERCQSAPFYIQGVTTGHTAFLATNLLRSDTPQIMETSSNWLIGRSQACPILAQDLSISRRHAVIGYSSENGFYIMDLGSSNGTWVNQTRLSGLDRQTLQDGDLIKVGALKVEFFVAHRGEITRKPALMAPDITKPML